MKVRATINLYDDNFNLVTLHPGDTVPEWAESRITNPAVIACESPVVPNLSPETGAGELEQGAPQSGVQFEQTEVKSGVQFEQTETTVPAVDYSKLKSDELTGLLTGRGLDGSGNKPEKIARLTEADAAAAAAAADDTAVDEIEVWAMNTDELKEFAAKHNIDVDGATESHELAAVISQALAQ